MTSEHKITLPDAPAPDAEARDAAITAALTRLDEKNRAGHQGSAPDGHLMRQAAPPPSRRRSVMMNARYAVAASLVALMAGSASWIYVQERPLVHEAYSPPGPKVFRDATAPKAREADKLAAVPPAPPATITADRSAAPPPNAGPSLTDPKPLAKVEAQQQSAQAPSPVAKAPDTRIVPAQPVSPNAVIAGRVPPAPAAPQIAAETRTGQQGVQGLFFPNRSDPSRMRRADNLAPAQDMAQAPGVAQPRIAPPEPMPPAEPAGRDKFAGAQENAFKNVRETPVSTFSIDVDTASYSFMRASLARNVLPQPASVRTEELINYFPYNYAAPESATAPFRTTTSVFPSPWSSGRKIIHVGIKGYAVQAATRPRANLVFLIDTSGSMNAPNRLPLVKQSLALLLGQLEAADRVAIVTYAGNAGTALEPTAASEKGKILGILERLESGGSTAGAEGIRQAYALAEQNFDPNGVNRVILATDGDFNVGITSRDELKGFIERARAKGIYLSVLGFGMGNYNDALMQALAQNGNGTAAYIDTINEARKVLVDEATSTLIPIAKDVKIQVEFNPATVAEYRLIGYETRMLQREDFNNDKVDAGDVGSGQTVTALYEIVPVGGPRVMG